MNSLRGLLEGYHRSVEQSVKYIWSHAHKLLSVIFNNTNNHQEGDEFARIKR